MSKPKIIEVYIGYDLSGNYNTASSPAFKNGLPMSLFDIDRAMYKRITASFTKPGTKVEYEALSHMKQALLDYQR